MIFDVILEEELNILRTQSTKFDYGREASNAAKKDMTIMLENELERIPLKKQVALNLKLGGFRLGKRIVVYTRNDFVSCLGYLSLADPERNIFSETNGSFVSCCWDSQTEKCLNERDKYIKKGIFEKICGYATEESLRKLLDSGVGTVMFILDLHEGSIPNEDGHIINIPELVEDRDKNGQLKDVLVNLFSGIGDKNEHDNSKHKNKLVDTSLKAYLKYFFSLRRI